MTPTSPPIDAIDAITAVIDDVAAGLAARDADRCVARFADDVRSVTNVRLVGRQAVRDAHLAVFASPTPPPASPRFEVVDVAFVRPDVALVTTEAFGPAPTPSSIVTWTLSREPDGWLVRSRAFSPVAA